MTKLLMKMMKRRKKKRSLNIGPFTFMFWIILARTTTAFAPILIAPSSSSSIVRTLYLRSVASIACFDPISNSNNNLLTQAYSVYNQRDKRKEKKNLHVPSISTRQQRLVDRCLSFDFQFDLISNND